MSLSTIYLLLPTLSIYHSILHHPSRGRAPNYSGLFLFPKLIGTKNESKQPRILMLGPSVHLYLCSSAAKVLYNRYQAIEIFQSKKGKKRLRDLLALPVEPTYRRFLCFDFSLSLTSVRCGRSVWSTIWYHVKSCSIDL